MILLFIPVFFLLLYGYALNFDIRHVRIAVEDRDYSPESRHLVSAFVNSTYFDLVASVTSEAEVSDLMDRDRIRAALIIPSDLGGDIRSGRPVSIEVLINGENANTAATVLGYAQAIIASESATLRDEGARPDAHRAPCVQLEPRVWYNPELKSSLFLVPGLLAYIAMITAVVSTALVGGPREGARHGGAGPHGADRHAVVHRRQEPAVLRRLRFLAALGVVFASMVLFELPVRGSWPLLLLSLGLFLAGALGMGLFISSVADSQQVAFQMALLSSFLPTMMLSGFIFPIASMPTALQVVTYIVPARYFLVALRGVLLKGVGIVPIAPQLAALAIFAVAVIGLAAMRLKREWA